MATNGCSAATFCGTCKNAFYFDVAETDLEDDAFTISIQNLKHKFQSNDNKFLLLSTEGRFQVQPLTTEQQCQTDCEFTIHIYHDSALEGRKGRAVMLYANKDGKKIVACCSEKAEIYPEAMELPPQIEETAHKALFYMTKLSASNKYMFESSAYPSKFLGFEPVDHNPSVNKLVLRDRVHDEVDEFSEVSLS